MLTKCVKVLGLVLNALLLHSRMCVSHKCTEHVWFVHVLKLLFSGVSVFVLRVKLDGTMPSRCHFNEKWRGKDGYKSWLWKDDKNPSKTFCFACKKSINLNVMGESIFVLKDLHKVLNVIYG